MITPVVPLNERKPMRAGAQKAFYEKAIGYELINCRKNFNCHNGDCRKEIRAYANYYYKYKGSIDWTFRYYRLWEKICRDCYYDHVLDPSSREWINAMEHRLATDGRQLDWEREKAGLPRSVSLSFERSRRR